MGKKRQTSTSFQDLRDADLFGQDAKAKEKAEAKAFVEETSRLEDQGSFAKEMKRLGMETKVAPAHRSSPGIGQIRGSEALKVPSASASPSSKPPQVPSQDKPSVSPSAEIDRLERKWKKAEEGEALALELLKQAQGHEKQLRAEVDAALSRIKEQGQALQSLRQRLDEAKQEGQGWQKKAEAAERSGEGEAISFRRFLQAEGIGEDDQAEVLQALATAFSKEAGRLLRVSAEPFRAFLKAHLRRVCAHPECREEIRRQGPRLMISAVSAKSCEVCRGSDNQRAFARLLSVCERLGLRNLLIVGGSEDSHTEVRGFFHPPFQLRLVNGDDRRFKAQATQDIEWADLIIIWGPTQLPHKISELYTDQRALAHGRLKIVNHRGVALMAQEMIDFLRTWSR